MFQAELKQMENRQTEVLEFASEMNRLTLRLDDSIRTLGTMESFSEITGWLKRVEEELKVQSELARDLSTVLETVLRFYSSSEEKILKHLEEGPSEHGEERLAFTETEPPGRWSELIRF